MNRLCRSTAAAVALLFASGATAAQHRSGTVVYATASRLYLNSGSRDGLAPGQVLELRRGDRVAGTCKVEQVSSARATCVGSGRPGDTFVHSSEGAPPAAKVERLPPPPPPSILARRRATLAATPFEKVDVQGPPGAYGGPHEVQFVLGHATWASTGIGPWHQERADATLRGVPLAGGFSLDLDLSARRWSRRSDPISFRPEDPAQLYVWEAAVSRRFAGGGPALALGRVRPWWTPGQTIIDGAQAGWRTAGGTEAGVFGGVIPDASTLAPSFGQGTFGTYWSGQHAGTEHSTLRFFRHEARVAFVNTADLGSRIEAEGLIEARITKRLDAAIDIRAARDDQRGTGLEAVRVDGGARPSDNLSLTGSFRYEGLAVPELDGPGHLLRGGPARHADVSAAWEPLPVLQLSLLAGLSSDLLTQETRRWLGPEVTFPRLFGGRTVLSTGFLLEEGWAPGQSAWVQLVTRTQGLFRVLTRISWFRTHNAPEPLDEFSASAVIDAQITSGLALRLSGQARTSLNGGRALTGGASGQTGVFSGELGGRF